MAISFREAVDIVAATLAAGDALAVRPEGREDASAYAVTWGPAEWIVGGDMAYMPIDNALTLVDKADGRVHVEPVTDSLDRLRGMTDVAL